jgi:Lrp/AsnC family leucine-responsive transcriptional regulator
MKLDAYDLKLLAEIQKVGSASQNELGKCVNLSTAAVSRRLKRMGEEGVIKGCPAVVAPHAVGYHQTIIAHVEVESERVDLIEAMQRSFEACPQVQQCYYVTGEWDFVVIFIVRHMAQYTELTRQLFFRSNNVKRFKTLVAMNCVKVGLVVPIDAEE